MKFLLTALLAAIILLSCTKWDDYKKYTANGEIIYTGKLDSVKMYSGKNRIRITGRFNADPKITAVKIFWNNKMDSLVYEVKGGLAGNVFDQTFPMPESITTFTVYSYDVDGNKSTPVYVVGKSFGENYRKTLGNRFITSLVYTAAKDSTTINWDAPLATAVQTEVMYPKNPTGDTVMVITPAKDSRTALAGFNYQTSKFTYRTIYRPDSTSIDTFATQYLVR
ncbi:hypothetical protein FAM09_09905 [Niastella caeni]|uniref:DUF4397 domain-containing protein n=1 Tax=Niastella caeni TaxID=2569763 RepID=A0A4S8HXZ6_9BACT|nr:DUF4998 domain-containing protein [Niastella caeni]THU40181.1 hypothetical protein FAM09_09905 [Niastella caeni]